MSTVRKLAVATTNLIRLKAFRDVLPPRAYPTTATVLFTLFDSTGTNAVSGAVGVAMPYVPGTTGRTTEYRGVLPASVALVVGASYVLKIRATDSLGDVHTFQRDCIGVAG